MGAAPSGGGWGGARRSVGGGDRPAGARERQSWAGDGSSVPHGRILTWTRGKAPTGGPGLQCPGLKVK
jgi:hypothetical protein